MTRQTSTVQINSFIRGLITEASPLTFPDNASLDERNFVLNRDGSRQRRLGMDLEEGYSSVDAGIGPAEADEIIFSSYSWKNPGGFPNKTIIVLQMGSRVLFHDTDISPLSDGLISAIDLSEGGSTFSYTTVDGNLVIANGESTIHIFEYDGSLVTKTERSLKTRDLFGVEDNYGGRDLNSGGDISYRPPTLTDSHLYNLRNQTWASPRTTKAEDYEKIRGDTIQAFRDRDSFPSNADAVTYAIGAWSNDDGILDAEESFLVDELINNPPGNYPAPKGYFIIDALNRGKSRLEQVRKLEENNPNLVYRVGNLDEDRTPGGATCVQEYAGRIWYGGFSGRVIGGNDQSPRLASYIFYSQLVQDPSDITKCYQEGDPTSQDAPDLLDTDGGFIRVDGAYNISQLVNVGSGLMVLAENGIWMVSGGSDYGFTANNNMRRKISDQGMASPSSVVLVDNTFMFWADDAIYHVAPDQFGDYQAQNLTIQTIQKFYDSISPIDKIFAKGQYDSYERKVRWVYRNRLLDQSATEELVFDVNLGAFYTNTLGVVGENRLPRVVANFEVSPFRSEIVQDLLLANTEDVLYNGEPVYIEQSIRGAGVRELAYLTILDTNPLRYSFSAYRDEFFRDWASFDGVGVDAPAYLVTGYLHGGDFLRFKQAPYVYFYFNRTEDGFVNEGGELVPSSPSSCFVQAQWEWSNSPASNRWGRKFQAYRYKRPYFAFSAEDSYDTGYAVIETRNKLRGKGKVLSLLIETEPEKDCQLLGWSMMIGVTGNI